MRPKENLIQGETLILLRVYEEADTIILGSDTESWGLHTCQYYAHSRIPHIKIIFFSYNILMVRVNLCLNFFGSGHFFCVKLFIFVLAISLGAW